MDYDIKTRGKIVRPLSDTIPHGNNMQFPSQICRFKIGQRIKKTEVSDDGETFVDSTYNKITNKTDKNNTGENKTGKNKTGKNLTIVIRNNHPGMLPDTNKTSTLCQCIGCKILHLDESKNINGSSDCDKSHVSTNFTDTIDDNKNNVNNNIKNKILVNGAFIENNDNSSPTNSQKWLAAFLLGLIFGIVSSPASYYATSYVTTSLGGIPLTNGIGPNFAGLAVHSIIFMIIVRILLW